MPTLETLQLPRIDTSAYGGREAKKIAGHLYQVEEQLRYVLGHLDEDNLSEGLKSRIESGGIGSEVLQALDSITLRVRGQDAAMSELRVSLGGISSTVQEQGGAITQLEQTAQGLAVTVEQNKNDAASALQQTAESIKTTVAETYSTKAELTSTVEQRAESILSTVADGYASKSELKQTAGSIRLTVTNGASGSTFTLKAGETTLSSGTITFTGLVDFVSKSDLSTAGRTTVNGGNITAGEISANLIKSGVIQNTAGTTIYDLNNGTIQMGATSGPHIVVDKEKVRWWLNASSPTGIFYSVPGVSYIGAASRYVYMGWVTEYPNTGLTHSEPNDSRQYYGVRIEEGSRAHWNVTKLECNGNYDNGNGTIEAAHIAGSVNAAAASINTASISAGYGAIDLCAASSPIPQFFDNGSGVTGEDGKCWIFPRDEFLAAVSANVRPQWQVTSYGGPLSVRRDGTAAIVTGEPGTAFDWLCLLPQKGCETLYCEPSGYDWSDSVERKDYTAGYELDSIDAFEQRLNDEVLKIREENSFMEETWPEQLERSVYA